MLTKFIDVERLIHSFKTAIACIIGFLLSKLIGFPADQWIVITIIVVMCAQLYVGSVVQKAYLRFVGTLVGCLFAVIALTTAGDTSLTVALTLSLSSFIFSYLATSQENLMYACTLGAVTTAIIMLTQKPTVLFAGQRFLEISIGILIAAVISQFVLPIHARTHLRRTQARTLTQLRDYFVACMVTHQVDVEKLYYQEYDETIVKTLSKQRQLAKEAARERLGAATFNPRHFMQTLQCEKEILRSIDFMHHALSQHLHPLFLKMASISDFNQSILQIFNTLIIVIEKDNAMDSHIHLVTVEELREAVKKETGVASEKDWFYIDGFLFSAEMLITCLDKLAKLYHVPIV